MEGPRTVKTTMLRLARSCLLASLILGGAQAAQADEIRTWTDENGVVHFSNVRPGGDRSRARYVRTPDGGTRVVLEGRKAPAGGGATKGGDTWQPRRSLEFDELLQEACERYRIPLALAKAVMAAESNYNPEAVSHAGAMGLMQLMPETAVTMYVDDILDPRENIHGGVRYLRVLTNEFDGDLVKVIAAYNAGPGAVRRADGIPNIAETQEYVKRVLRLYEQFKQALPERS